MTNVLNTSNLYNLCLTTNNDMNEVLILFFNKIRDFGFTETKVEFFLNNYKNIQYNETNISQYINLVLYFQYKISDEFINYVINQYVFDKMCLLNKLINFNIIAKIIKEKCNDYKWKSNDQLLYISKYIIIKKLNLKKNSNITNDGIKNMTNIHTLNLKSNNIITDDGIKNLTKIHTLNLESNNNITDDGIKNLTNIHTLNLSYDKIITDDGIKHMADILCVFSDH